MSHAGETGGPPASLARTIAAHARSRPVDAAYLTDRLRLSWAGYDAGARALARLFVELQLAPGERVAVLLPDGPGVHVAFTAAEWAGLVAVGLGPRAGWREIEHLLRRSGAVALLSAAEHAGRATAEAVADLRARGVGLRHHLVATGEPGLAGDFLVDGNERPLPTASAALDVELERRASHPGDLWLLNSTSGTTGMPKCVQHDQLRWFAFHRFAVEAGALSSDDVFLSAVPAPFGFGLWTGHVTPTLLGIPAVVVPRFSPEVVLDLIERHRVSVAAAVTTQFVMMLDSPELERTDLSSLRVLFTGGEPVPAERAAEFEERSGARVLQFYGSNETGAVSRTTLDDPRDRRLHTSGRVIPEMQVRLFDGDGADVTASGCGQPGCRGPTLSRGYWNDDRANAELWRPDGWMLLGDIVEIDDAGTLRVVGRTDDFIIRGGKNVSAVAVEEAVGSHPAVVRAVAVGMPDPVFGERVCAFVELRTGRNLDLEGLRAHLLAKDVSKEVWPERLETVVDWPHGSGGKILKRPLRERAARLAATDGETR